jgi:threonine dehydratase
MSGIAATLRHLVPRCRTIGVEAAASPAFHTSLAAGAIATIDPQPTLADGLAGNMDPDDHLDIVRDTVDRIGSSPARTCRPFVASSRRNISSPKARASRVTAVMSGALDRGPDVAVVCRGEHRRGTRRRDY